MFVLTIIILLTVLFPVPTQQGEVRFEHQPSDAHLLIELTVVEAGDIALAVYDHEPGDWSSPILSSVAVSVEPGTVIVSLPCNSELYYPNYLVFNGTAVVSSLTIAMQNDWQGELSSAPAHRVLIPVLF